MAAMLLYGSLIAAQEVRSMTADEVMTLALQNHQQLKLSEKKHLYFQTTDRGNQITKVTHYYCIYKPVLFRKCSYYRQGFF